MRLTTLTILAIACSGDKATTPSGEGSDTPISITCDLPPYEPSEMDCSQLTYAFNRLVDEASDCNTDDDCRIVRPVCETWDEIGCFYAVNFCFDEETFNAFNATGSSCVSAGSAGCYCGDVEPVARCISHACTAE